MPLNRYFLLIKSLNFNGNLKKICVFLLSFLDSFVCVHTSFQVSNLNGDS
ncbi:hypothetical protein HanIR_Chr08g0355591 [Helianthus annuus]|nr:hypothetical protein HanIR_Chr08g0355591 [Helianthus annuus]